MHECSMLDCRERSVVRIEEVSRLTGEHERTVYLCEWHYEYLTMLMREEDNVALPTVEEVLDAFPGPAYIPMVRPN
jgi:hypothetical protein